MFGNGSGQNVQSLERTTHKCFLPSFGSFGQTVSEEKNLKNQPIRNKSRLWQPCWLTDWDEISNLYRGPSIDTSYQVSVHLAKRFQKNRPIRNMNCLGQPCLLMDRDKMNSLYRRPSIDASYHISDQLALWFQSRRLKCEKLTDDGRWTPSDGKSSHCLWQGELKRSHFMYNYHLFQIFIAGTFCSFWTYI